MKIDLSTFNFPEFIAAFILAISLWILDRQRKPRFLVKIGKPSLLFGGSHKVLNLKIVNEKRKGISSFFNHVATQMRVYLHFLDYPTKAAFNKVTARWNSSREPVTPDYKNVDVGLALTNPREVLVPGEEGEISVAIRKKDNSSCFPFNNESYLYANKDYSKHDWEIKDDKFILKVEIQSAEAQDDTRDFLVLNKGTFEQFKIIELTQ